MYNKCFEGDTVSVLGKSIDSFLADANMKRFMRYQGSLTTPGCFESVTWSVFHKTLDVSSNQVI